MTRRIVDFPFLGSRTYVQSSTLLNFLAPFLLASPSFTMRIPKLIPCNRMVFEVLDAGEADTGFSAQCVASDGSGRQRQFVFSATEDCRTEFRVDYDEEAAIAGWSLDDGKACLADGARPFTVFERIIALNKAYLSVIAPLAAGEKLLATRLDISRPINPAAELRLAHIRLLDGTHHATSILLDGVRSGVVFFARQSASQSTAGPRA